MKALIAAPEIVGPGFLLTTRLCQFHRTTCALALFTVLFANFAGENDADAGEWSSRVTAMIHRPLVVTLGLMFCFTTFTVRAEIPADYRGKPFADTYHQAGAPNIPGIVQCALYDLGGEGVAYHDTETTNNGSGRMNLETGHQRAHAGAYLWHFRKDEGVDLSFVKDTADLSHTNLVSPHINQLYIGWTENGEWCNYTVNVARPGAYRIKTLYSFQTNTVTFDLNGKPATTCRLPVPTANYHQWNFATIGIIQFPEAGPQLLTFHYGQGNNFACLEFELVEPPPAAKP